MSLKTPTLVLLIAAAACSDDTTGAPDPDAKVGPDSCCAGDAGDGPEVDLPPPDPDSCCAPDAETADLPPPGPDTASDLPPPDLPPAVPDLGGKKLIAWAQCSTSTKCKAYCGAIGSKSEGWYDGCTNTLLKDPFTGSPYWDQCTKCVVTCDAVGTKSEGWYAQCP
jgi:hypothetical protein